MKRVERWEGEEYFKKSNKTQRSLNGIRKAKGSGVEEMLGKWKEEMGEVMRFKKHEGVEGGIEADEGKD